MKEKKKLSKEMANDMLCPCGSGHVYGECCKGKTKWLEDGSKVMALEFPEGFEEYRKLLEERLGRPLKPEDKLFPDFDIQKYNKATVVAMIKSSIHPVHIYTMLNMEGLLLGEDNIDKASGADIAQHRGLVEEFMSLGMEDRALFLSAVIGRHCPGIASYYNRDFCNGYVLRFQDDDEVNERGIFDEENKDEDQY